MTTYYIDNTYGLDTSSGLMYTGLVVDSTADTTHITDAGLHSICKVGSYVFVTGRTGARVTAFDDTTHIATITPAITGLIAGDVYYLISPWKTINQYTTTTTRSSGDIAYVRANQTHTLASAITLDEAGTTSYISLIGCNASQSIDPWHDSSDVRPIINFAGGDYYFITSGMDNWYLKNLKLYNTAHGYGLIEFNLTFGWLVENCLFDNLSTGAYLVMSDASGRNTFKDCVFYGTGSPVGSMRFNTSTCNFEGCTFNAVTATGYALSFGGSNIVMKDCQIGNTNTFTSGAFLCIYGGTVHMRNCKSFNSTLAVLYHTNNDVSIYSEDHQQVAGDNYIWHSNGTITKSTAIYRTGGATTSARIETTSLTGTTYPLTINNNQLKDFAVWCPAAATTITVYMRSLGTWGGVYPTAAQLYVEASYPSSATTGARTLVVSNDVLTDETTWVGFDVTFTPSRAGFVYLTVKINKYIASCGCYVDIKPVVT